MNLFKYENDILTIDPMAYSLVPFKVIWDRDKTKSKKNAFAEMSYVFFMTDYKSDFSDILDDDDRSVEVIKVLDLKKGWKPDLKISDAIEFYKQRKDGIAMRMLGSAKILASKIEKYCRTVDLNEKNEKGAYVHNVKQINEVLQQFGRTIDSLNKLEDQVKKEVAENKTMIGSKGKEHI